jgi:hypothetical protein
MLLSVDGRAASYNTGDKFLMLIPLGRTGITTQPVCATSTPDGYLSGAPLAIMTGSAIYPRAKVADVQLGATTVLD